MAAVIDSVGTASRDFSTVTAHEASLGDHAGDDVTAELYADSDFDERFIVDDATPDSIKYTTASNEEGDGTANTGVRFLMAAGAPTTIAELSTTIPLIFEKIEIDENGGNNKRTVHMTGTDGLVTDLLIHGKDSSKLDSVRGLDIASGANEDNIAKNIIAYDFISSSSTGTQILIGGGIDANAVDKAINCIAHDGGGVADVFGFGMLNDTAAKKLLNCAATANTGGSGADFQDSGPSNADFSYIMSGDTSSSGTGSKDSITAADQYVSIVGGSENFHIRTAIEDMQFKGGDFAGQGLGPSADSDVPADGIRGNTRHTGATTDIGADYLPFGSVYAQAENDAAAATTIAVTFAAGVKPIVGDLLIANHFTGDAVSNVDTAGWAEGVLVTNGTETDQGGQYFKKVAATSENTVTCSSGSSDQHMLELCAVRGEFEDSPLDITGSNGRSVADPVLVAVGSITVQKEEFLCVIKTARSHSADMGATNRTGTATPTSTMEQGDGVTEGVTKRIEYDFQVLTNVGTVGLSLPNPTNKVFQLGYATYKQKDGTPPAGGNGATTTIQVPCIQLFRKILKFN